jgi:type I restriction enzyme S subunit
MEVKPGYKKTEVGVIPEEWDVVKFEETARVIDSLHRTPSFVENGYPMVRVSDIKTGNLKFAGVLMVSEAVFEEFTKNYKPMRGDIVLSRVGSYGISSFVETDEPFCMGQNTVVLYPRLPARFLYYVLNSQGIRQQIEDGSYGSGYKSLSLKNIKELRIPVPPLPEQRAIAAALADVDALISGLDRLIAKKRDLKQAAMQELLMGKRRLPGFCGEWETKQLGEILKVRHGKSQHGIVENGGEFPILATGGEIGRTNQYLYNKPSVLIGRKGTIDSPQYVDSPFWTIDTLFFTDINNSTLAKFIFYKFNTINWRNYNEASGVPSLNASTIESIEISCPYFEEQTAIATVLSDMDTEISALEQRRDKTKALKQGMMQELLTGRIRLGQNFIAGATCSKSPPHPNPLPPQAGGEGKIRQRIYELVGGEGRRR